MGREMIEEIILEFKHNNKDWLIIKITTGMHYSVSYMARYKLSEDKYSDTGPFSSVQETYDFVTPIQSTWGVR